MNYLGIDYGEVNYGFAIGNSITKNSTTYFSEKIASEKEALKFIENIGSENIGKTPVEFFQKMNNDSRA